MGALRPRKPRGRRCLRGPGGLHSLRCGRKGGARMILAKPLIAGEAEGPPLELTTPLSFWGGLDVATGRVMDRHHPDFGKSLTRTILMMEQGRGSSSGSSVLAEAMRIAMAPLAILL